MIYILTKKIGWNDKDVNGLASKIFGISRQETARETQTQVFQIKKTDGKAFMPCYRFFE